MADRPADFPRQMVVRLTDDMWDRLHREAATNERTVAGTVRRAIRLYLEAPEEERR